MFMSQLKSLLNTKIIPAFPSGALQSPTKRIQQAHYGWRANTPITEFLASSNAALFFGYVAYWIGYLDRLCSHLTYDQIRFTITMTIELPNIRPDTIHNYNDYRIVLPLTAFDNYVRSKTLQVSFLSQVNLNYLQE